MWLVREPEMGGYPGLSRWALVRGRPEAQEDEMWRRKREVGVTPRWGPEPRSAGGSGS